MLNHYQTNLVERKALTNDVIRCRFQLTSPAHLAFCAGQYVIMEVPQPDGALARRLYSIASAETTTDRFDLLVKLVPNGAGSVYLRGLAIGASVNFQGPAGQFYLRDSHRPKLFLATGTGIAPMLALLEKLRVTGFPTPVKLLWGLATIKDVFYLAELKQLKQTDARFDFQIYLSRETSLAAVSEPDRPDFGLGHIDVGLKSLVMSGSVLGEHDYYLCGRREMVETMRQTLTDQYRVPPGQVYFEKY
ncbi:FAD-binding oxidoreductase [Patescibacteria group bacterium]|nr:FAD-binding oxidoreductase [Patescibacteria group bacterium]MCL5091497.1 FAD-binding oxidoreductase [Patescibacteria group bacterium]